MEFAELEVEARQKAASHVANMLHTPDKLEKVHQMKWNISRKKASVEALLKTAMQSQLDGVKSGLSQLEKALGDMREIRTSMDEIEKDLQIVPGLIKSMEQLHDETSQHSQLATARENLKHLFTVPENVEQTKGLISEGKLLEAHKNLVELECSRDDLLYELFKLSSPSYSTFDKQLVNDYFAPVSELSLSMEKQIKFLLRRTLNTVRKDPKVIVTALRIIEREEKSDQEFLQRRKSSGFLPPDRPKMWKAKCMSVLKTNVAERIEGNQLDVRSENKMWLVRHLERIRQITLEDLRVAKTLCQPVFPPYYQILDVFIDLYIEAINTRLREIIDVGLEGQEYVSLLSWVIQTYPGPELMRSLSLGIQSDKIKPLLDAQTVEQLQEQYLKNMSDNYSEWMKNTLNLEVEDWKKEGDPELDNEGCFHTSAPKIIYQMIDENLLVATTISPDLTRKVLVLSINEVANFGRMYQNAVRDYKNKYFRDRTAISMFTRYMIAIVNNCERFEELAQELKSRWWKSEPRDQQDAATKFEVLLKTFQELRSEAAGYLLDESFLDIDVHFGDIFTTKWIASTDAIDTVCATLEDYFEDYQYLQPKNFDQVITEAQDRVARRYLTSMLQPTANPLRQKITLKSPQDRRDAAEKIKAEAAQLKRFFHKVAGDMADFDSPFDALKLLAEVLNSDQDMLALDIGTLAKRYPDITYEQVLCLLMLRGDIPKTELRTKVSGLVPETPASSSAAKSIFSQVNVSANTNMLATAAKDVLNPLFSKNTAPVESNPFSGGAAGQSNKSSAVDLNPFANKSSASDLNPFGSDSNNPFDSD